MSLRSLKRRYERLRREGESVESSSYQSKVTIPRDTVEFCRSWLFYDPYPYMWPFLRDKSHFIANVQARQTGKTFNGMAKLLHLALLNKESLALITAPKFDQVKNIAFKALTEHLLRMQAGNPGLFDIVCGKGRLLRTVIRLRNGSTILAESPVPETIRGHTAKVIYLMEANFIRDDEDLYTALLFTLNTTNGYLIAESTPWNTDSIFHKMFNDQSYSSFSRHRVPYTEALPPNGPLTPEIVKMIEIQLAGDPARWRREMLCEWTEDMNAWLPTSLITLAQDSSLDYAKATVQATGEFFVGADFGKERDHSVVVALERFKNHLHLRHLHVFPLETSYGSVIGYIKRLQDNWQTIRSVYADVTGVGDYIVEDMHRGGVRGVEGIKFTEQSKEEMATALKEAMRKVQCPTCSWEGFIDSRKGEWRTNCPACDSSLRPLLHIPYDSELFHELNVERYQLNKSGKLLFSHPDDTHDDRFWALALAVYAAEHMKNAPRPIVR